MSESPAETSIPIGDWSMGSLKAYHDMMVGYERQISDQRDLRYQERWQAQENATKYAQEKANEFRGSLDDLSTKQATKLELHTAIDTLSEKIEVNSKEIGELRSRLDIGNPAVQLLQSRADNIAGIKQGSQITKTNLYIALGAVGTVVTIISGIIGSIIFLVAKS